MLTKNFIFKDFDKKKVNSKLKKHLKEILISKSEIMKSLSVNYNYNYKKKFIKKLKGFKEVRIFGMGGSGLGANAIYDFLNHKIKKNFYFLSNLNKRKFPSKKKIFKSYYF